MNQSRIGSPPDVPRFPGAGASHDDDEIDADWALADAIIAGDLSPTELEAAEGRIAREPGLWLKIGPVITAFAAIHPLDGDALAESLTPALAKRLSHAPRPRLHESSANGANRTGARSIEEEQRAEAQARAHARDYDTPRRSPWRWVWRAAAVLVAYVATKAYFVQHVAPVYADDETTFTFFPHFGDDRAADVENAMLMNRGFSDVLGTGPLVVDSTGADQFRLVREPGKPRVTIRPNSRYSYRSERNLFGLIFGSTAFEATVDGEASLRVFNTPVKIYTRHWIIELQAGAYAIRAIPHSGEVLLTVGEGEASIQERGGKIQPTYARRGTYARLPDEGRLTIGANGAGFPIIGGDPKVPMERDITPGLPAREAEHFRW